MANENEVNLKIEDCMCLEEIENAYFELMKNTKSSLKDLVP